MQLSALLFFEKGEFMLTNVNKFLKEVEEITVKTKEMGYSENGTLEILKIYFSKKSVGEY